MVQHFAPGGLYALRAAVAAHATALGLAEQSLGRVLLAATELATNAICHGAGFGTLRLWRSGDLLMLRVVDTGPGIARPDRVGVEPARLAARTGRGLWIVRQVCDQMHISAAPGTTVTIGVRLKVPPG
jgi:anti-sigma regulatory factor (Ser/Thr protein kinase)